MTSDGTSARDFRGPLLGLLGLDRETCAIVGDGHGSSSGSVVRNGRWEGRSPPPWGPRPGGVPR